MKAVLVSSVFPPEHTFSSQTNAQTAEELAKRGHSVHVYAPFPSHPKGRLFDGYKRALYTTTTPSAGYTLTHCFGTFSRSSTLMSRFAWNLSFGITSGVRILFGKTSRCDFLEHLADFCNRHPGDGGQTAPGSAGFKGAGRLSGISRFAAPLYQAELGLSHPSPIAIR
jgi:hypothetical protein